jgi:Histidine kinase-, DNA gyrase B-, and HSP90-like ATPase
LTIATVTTKTQIGPVDGTPDKRMYWSIISDYGLKTGLFELVDNALDRWTIATQSQPLTVDITLDAARQLISINDNAGGVKEDRLRVLLAPGGSMNDPNAELIGIFGVGSKRAGIALGEHVEIRTRYRKERSLQLDITAEWLETQDWTMNYYAIPDITPGTTQIQISHLRKPFVEQDIGDIRLHLGETYAWFLGRGSHLTLNGVAVAPRTFETWAFPPDFQPRSAAFEVEIAQSQKVQVEMTGGLIRDRNPDEENYGVYFYCNNRLVVKELKAREAGYFVTAEAGVPHPDASLCRVIVRLQGAARLMPWNSSKSAINFDHPLFQYVRPTLIQLTSHYSSLSRRFKDDWDGKVFAYDSGSIEAVQPENAEVKNPLVLPPLPRVNKPQVEKLKSLNRTQIHDQPWTLGLVETMAAVEVIGRQRFETKNRIALILLDSNFEIALKEFIVHREDLFPPSTFGKAAIQKLFEKRSDVIAAVSQKVTIPKKLLTKAQHFYNIRNKLIHERATAEPTDNDIQTYSLTIEKVLTILFKLRF